MTECAAKIRYAEARDAGELASLHAEIFPEEAWTRSWFEKQLKKQNSVILIAEENSHSIGLLVLSKVLEEGEVLALGVRRPWRGEKVGRALLEAAIAERIDHLFLEVAEDNDPALALYRSMGFFENGRRPNYYSSGADAIMMMKSVS